MSELKFLIYSINQKTQKSSVQFSQVCGIILVCLLLLPVITDKELQTMLCNLGARADSDLVFMVAESKKLAVFDL